MTSREKTFVQTLDSILEQPMRNHLRNVYACLSLSVITAGAGAYIEMFTALLPIGLLSLLGSIGFLIALYATNDENGKNRLMRFGFLLSFAFFTGHSMGASLNEALKIDPCIIMTPLVATAMIFISFTLSALLASIGSLLYLGELASAGLITLILLSLMDLFIDADLIDDTMLYLGLVVMFINVLYHTQLIIEKRRHGDTDFVDHSLELFLDFRRTFNLLFRYCLQKEKKKRSNRKL